MSEFYPLIFVLVIILILSLDSWLFLRLLNRSWWSHRWVRLTTWLIPVFGGICIILWALGVISDSYLFTGIGATGAAITLLVEIALLLSLPISGAFHIVINLIDRIKKQFHQSKPIDQERRLILKTAAAIFPAAAISTGVGGLAHSFGEVKIPAFTFTYSDLPPALEGLRIFQISDAHLGYYVILDDLEQALLDVEPNRPDVVLITGDLADDLRLLPEALDMISQLKPRLGCYACLGNHEYYRGIREVIKIYSQSTIPLLINNGITVDVDGSPLYIAGADDPRWMRGDHDRFFSDTISRSIRLAPDGAFKIVMSHRPEGFDPAAEQGVQLTLSGHTHGGQIGIGGRSFFDLVTSFKYLWGHYAKANGSQLYTSSGIGHWFPFRLGCPPEAPMITLSSE